ncbi:hypothetical protein AK830_g8589 [Neonectria ditissima]|uniref:Uncharacterized protein n=1 Tax=Neonectria ditissima TaxID=78410 RepID=A0A0P7BDW8_9HYPO|nr:hypothetical protein AK830_g8589 [Neonectria ditissima]
MINLGKLCDSSAGGGVPPPASVNALMAAAEFSQLTDQQVVDKAIQDAKLIPSVWFVNFVDPAAAAQQQTLAKHMQSVDEYRNWASLIWWRAVFSQRKIPQDGSEQAIEKRSAYCAKVAAFHMKQTPWYVIPTAACPRRMTKVGRLAMNSDRNVSKNIQCNAADFHTQIAQNALDGFVSVTPTNVQALEGLFTSLRLEISHSFEPNSTKTIICQRYQYISEIDVIRSCEKQWTAFNEVITKSSSDIRVISFNITRDMKNVNDTKGTERRITCELEYNEYEAAFNESMWNQTSQDIDGAQKTLADALRKQQTVDSF